ncbi:MAG TPA: TetR/AcrR family transcriptional regulator [Steroidobacteraceae bacterium]|nr:TetR/AcrR family transcriptional regulator [Steroidobacteraceae bacterium]
MALIGKRKRSLHARGIERRTILLESARALLAERDLDQVSLADVAARAGVPKSSAYHFYADIQHLYAALLARVQGELIRVLSQPLRGRFQTWPDVVTALTKRGAAFYMANSAARQLQIGPKTPPALKLHDRRSDIAIARLHEEHIASVFELPPIANRPQLFYRAVEIADLMFCLSMLEHGSLTKDMCREAGRAASAYLAIYLPAALPYRNAETPGCAVPWPRKRRAELDHTGAGGASRDVPSHPHSGSSAPPSTIKV